ncbi:uncharacterized protein B0H64DRAFT_403697 [Chaetomium fimeti]|uniref:Secreted protein n=1 Tax=Chaetomium fimeti TaxID=1854472 RepID=A0AAE0HBC0_9PEZI|nr:hypothetical protein B0H64DRAFT_403697 [Chaetomium fimeti]
MGSCGEMISNVFVVVLVVVACLRPAQGEAGRRLTNSCGPPCRAQVAGVSGARWVGSRFAQATLSGKFGGVSQDL